MRIYSFQADIKKIFFENVNIDKDKKYQQLDKFNFIFRQKFALVEFF